MVPTTCVLFTFPNISASNAVFIVMIPKRRTISGLLLISPGRSTNLFLKKSRLENTSSSTVLLIVREQPLAKRHFPSFINLITASCTTSVYISNTGTSGLLPNPLNTAFAIFPTPDCSGRNSFGIRPFFNWETKKLQTLSPIRVVTSSTGANSFTLSGKLVSTIPIILWGSTFITGEPILSLGL